MKGVKSILKASTRGGLLDILSSIRSHSTLTTAQAVAGINQCAVLQEAVHEHNYLVDEVLGMLEADQFNENIYSSMVRAYYRTGYAKEAISAYKCLDQPGGGDIAAAMGAAAAIGNSSLADDLWKAAHAAGLLDRHDRSHADALRQLSANYIAAKVRDRKLSHVKQLLKHCVPLDGESWQSVLAASCSGSMVDILWEHIPVVSRTADVYSVAAWTYLSVGVPNKSLSLCQQAQEAGVASLSHFCCATEAHLTVLSMEGHVDVKALKSNIDKAAEYDADEEWLQSARSVMQKTTAA